MTKEISLIQTQEALMALENLFHDNPLKLKEFLSGESYELKQYLETKAKKAIMASNQALHQGLDQSIANEYLNNELACKERSEVDFTNREIAKLAYFKVQIMGQK